MSAPRVVPWASSLALREALYTAREACAYALDDLRHGREPDAAIGALVVAVDRVKLLRAAQFKAEKKA